MQYEADMSAGDAARAITDGTGDEGFDAVAVSGREIFVVQAKWNDKGTAGFGNHDIAAVVDGLRYLFNRNFEQLGPKMAPHVDELTRALKAPRPRVTLVLALVNGDVGKELHVNARNRLENQIRALHPRDPSLVEVKVVNLLDMYHFALDEARRKVTLVFDLDSPGRQTKPFTLYYGTVPASTVAAWYAGENGAFLTDRNVRNALEDTEVNSVIRNTLIQHPEHFLYWNGGITLVCDSLGGNGVDPPDKWAPVGLCLEGASVINGAQTGDAICAVMQSHPDRVAQARVHVRIISLEDCPENFGDAITIAANTQNPIEARDFRALEQEQVDLREDFQLSLGLTYSAKRGEGKPERDRGCTMEEAAFALAAVYPDPVCAAEARQDPAWLWEKKNYQAVFGPLPTAFRVWRCVGLLRAVRDALGELGELDGVSSRRVSQVAEHADLLLAHVLFHTMETGDLDAEDGQAWQEQLAGVPERVRQVVPHMVDVIDGAYGRTSQVVKAVTLPERAKEVADRLSWLLMTAHLTEPEGEAEPEATREPEDGVETGAAAQAELALTAEAASTVRQPAAGGRSTRAVTTIFERGLVAEGTRFELVPDTEADRKNLPRWIQEDPRRGRAMWRSSKSQPLVWEVDGQAYSPSSLARRIRREAMGNDQQVQGTKYWADPDGRSLLQIAQGGAAAVEGAEE
ncbi:AIPR family protein [Streptomyces sp. NBC_00038]|uniref:AIPR family protein n=1 Tax=Streptomyces sp. NBC_00038 TaxID=2903615 RepID=UPI002255C88B|nr:AIPR family protein [Streptomyces sp. NBC_00038]MCX5560281.1 AIPR family protein [Streptomyces sp. NBC_00038]